MRRVAEQFPDLYRATENIQLISSLIPSILTGNSRAPIDYGNALRHVPDGLSNEELVS